VSDKEFWPITLSVDATVGDLKSDIASIAEVAADAIELHFSGKKMDGDDIPLSDTGVSAEAIVEVRIRIPVPIQFKRRFHAYGPPKLDHKVHQCDTFVGDEHFFRTLLDCIRTTPFGSGRDWRVYVVFADDISSCEDLSFTTITHTLDVWSTDTQLQSLTRAAGDYSGSMIDVKNDHIIFETPVGSRTTHFKFKDPIPGEFTVKQMRQASAIAFEIDVGSPEPVYFCAVIPDMYTVLFRSN
jgi:hypothetical protein